MRNRVGERYGKLVVCKHAGFSLKRNGVHAQARWECVCDCGNSSTVLGSALTTKSTRSCGHCPNAFQQKEDGTTIISLTRTNGDVHECVIDSRDFELVRRYRWYPDKAGRTFYAVTNVPNLDGTRSRLKMHRLIFPSNRDIDHKDRNGLNNRRSNLRQATDAQNNWNQQTRRGTSQFKGVYLRKDYARRGITKYYATISVHGRRISLGVFDSEETAAHVYDEAAKKYHGEFALLNFPPATLQEAA